MTVGPNHHLTPQSAPPEGGTKREYRAWAKTQRAHMRTDGLHEQICEHIRRSPLFAYAQTVGIYLPMPGEVKVELLVQPGKLFAAPRMHNLPQPHLTFHELGTAPLEQHPWGVRQPAATAAEVPLNQMDLLIVPGLLFDRHGARLGYGKGYYDRLLAGRTSSKPITLGVAFEAMVVPELPAEPHDLAVDHLVTELGFRPLSSSSSLHDG